MTFTVEKGKASGRVILFLPLSVEIEMSQLKLNIRSIAFTSPSNSPLSLHPLNEMYAKRHAA